MRPCYSATNKSKRIGDDDIPDSVLVEILCRLPCCKSAVQLKRVSKRWRSLINDPFFVSRFLCLCLQRNKPIPRALIFSNQQYKLKFLSMSSNSNLDLDNYNCSDFEFLKNSGRGPLPPDLPNRPVKLLASYNDLVLCCSFELMRQPTYYICNPRTKQWRALPPGPTIHNRDARVGFVCNPYYYKKDTRSSDDFHLDFNYEFKVVRMYSESSLDVSSLINVEIYSSATGEWTESTVTSPESFIFGHLVPRPGIVHKGMLHWCACYGFVFVLDLNNNNNNNNNNEDHKYSCHFIKGPQNRIDSWFDFLGVDCRGRMRLCELESDGINTHLGIWELDENRGRWTSIIQNLCVKHRLNNIWVLAFDPEDPDILYLELCGHVVRCNIRTGTLEKNHLTINMPPYCASGHRYHRSVIPLALPWWPTPVEMETDISDDEAELQKTHID